MDRDIQYINYKEKNLRKKDAETENMKENHMYKNNDENNIEVDFKESYMFSDSLSDKPLLDMVGKPYLINYKNGHKNIEILKWN